MHDSKHVRVAGFGGQGVMMFGQMIAYGATINELNTLWFPSYGPETRGGTANCSVIVSDKEIGSPVFQNTDHLIVFNAPSLDKFMDKVVNGGLILYNSSLIHEVNEIKDVMVIGVPVNDIAGKLENEKVMNMVMFGAYLALTNMFNQHTIEAALKKFLGSRKSHMLDINLEAIEQGRQYMKKLGVHYA